LGRIKESGQDCEKLRRKFGISGTGGNAAARRNSPQTQKRRNRGARGQRKKRRKAIKRQARVPGGKKADWKKIGCASCGNTV